MNWCGKRELLRPHSGSGFGSSSCFLSLCGSSLAMIEIWRTPGAWGERHGSNQNASTSKSKHGHGGIAGVFQQLTESEFEIVHGWKGEHRTSNVEGCAARES